MVALLQLVLIPVGGVTESVLHAQLIDESDAVRRRRDFDVDVHGGLFEAEVDPGKVHRGSETKEN